MENEEEEDDDALCIMGHRVLLKMLFNGCLMEFIDSLLSNEFFKHRDGFKFHIQLLVSLDTRYFILFKHSIARSTSVF